MVNKIIFINNNIKIKNETCYISGDKFSKNDYKYKNIIQLDCKHCFKYNYFIHSYYNLKHTNNHIKCPYCGLYISNIPFIIHKKYIKYKMKEKRKIFNK